MCIKLDLIEGNALFIDGSPFRANASIKKTWTKERCKKHLERLSGEIDKLVEESINIDKEEQDKESLVKVKKELTNKLELKKKIEEINKTLEQKPPKSQHNTTDPDCVKTRSRQATHAGYNAQVAVDAKHGLIVHTEALSHNQDYNKFNDQLNKATKVLKKKPKFASSDCGYYSLEDIAKVDKDVTVVMPSIKQAQKEKKIHPLRPFNKEQFKYNPSTDEYICPEGKHLRYQGMSNTSGKMPCRVYRASGKDCRICCHFRICTISPNGRTIIRSKQENLCKKLHAIYSSPLGQKIYKLRKEKVELPFGHMKRNLGAWQFMLRGKEKVDAELALLSTSFNIARMITLIGIPVLLTKLKGT